MGDSYLNTKWSIEPLSKHVHYLETGSRPKGGVSNYTDGIPSVSAEQINPDGSFYWDKIKFVPEIFFKSVTKGIITPDSILIVKDGATTGKCAFIGENFPYSKAMVNEHTFILKTKPTLNSKFVYYFLKSPYCEEFFDNTRSHGVIGGLNQSFVKDIFIPIPLIAEQRRIVSIIDNLIENELKLKKISLEIDKETIILRKTIIYNAIKNEAINYDILANFLIDRPRNGWSPPAKSLSNNRTPVLTLSAVTGYQYGGNHIKYTNATVSDSAHYLLQKGDLLISRSNTRELVGHAAIYDGTPFPCICSDLIMKMRVNPKKAITKFIHYWLQSNIVRNYIEKNARGTSDSMKKINQGHVKNIPIPIVSLPKQADIVNKLDKFESKNNQIQKLRKILSEELSTFTPSLLAKAFRGEL